MRHVTTIPVIAGLFAGLVQPAGAEVVNIARAGAWTAYSGVAVDGKRVCGIGETGDDGRTVNIKYFENAASFEILIGKPSWAIPPGTNVDVSITFGQASPWHGRASGDGRYLRLSVPMARLGAFIAEFKAASTMFVTFPGGSEPAWRGSLIGTTAIVSRLRECVDGLALAATPGGTTQPFGRSADDTQPEPNLPSVKQPSLNTSSVKE